MNCYENGLVLLLHRQVTCVIKNGRVANIAHCISLICIGNGIAKIVQQYELCTAYVVAAATQRIIFE